ncbi:MAG TPA: hypothetical protein ENH82_06210, partial [bacterium]|nr:hypothetical protein [bacterium]
MNFDIPGVISILITIASLIFGIYQFKERRKLKENIRAQASHLYDNATGAHGLTILAFSEYKKAHSKNIKLKIIEFLSKADTLGRDVLIETIRQIHNLEPFSKQTIQQWVNEGRIIDQHVP